MDQTDEEAASPSGLIWGSSPSSLPPSLTFSPLPHPSSLEMGSHSSPTVLQRASSQTLELGALISRSGTQRTLGNPQPLGRLMGIVSSPVSTWAQECSIRPFSQLEQPSSVYSFGLWTRRTMRKTNTRASWPSHWSNPPFPQIASALFWTHTRSLKSDHQKKCQDPANTKCRQKTRIDKFRTLFSSQTGKNKNLILRSNRQAGVFLMLPGSLGNQTRLQLWNLTFFSSSLTDSAHQRTSSFPGTDALGSETRKGNGEDREDRRRQKLWAETETLGSRETERGALGGSHYRPCEDVDR